MESYNRPAFIELDPVSIPHRYSKKEDIEISEFLAATIAWGNRRMISRNADRMMALLDDSPLDFIYFLKALRNIYKTKGGLESIFNEQKTGEPLKPAVLNLYMLFFELPHIKRTERYV